MSNTLFGTDGVRGVVNKFPMLPEMAMRIGLAAGSYFRSEDRRHRVVIGKDTRLSGYIFESALTAGLCASGMDVFQVGPLPTPAIAFLTRNMRADFGIVISASHNPFSDNGIKLFDKNGFKLEDHVEDAIAEMVLNNEHEWSYPESSEVGRAFKIKDAPGRYIVSIKNTFPSNLTLDGLRVVIDCANGANYKVAPMALHELGADVVAINTEPNGTNINHLCGSMYPDLVAEKVRETRADIGLALDGDADRLIVVDELGNTLDGDQIMAICAHDMIKKNKLKGSTVVSTVMSNMALEVFLRDNDVNLIRTDVGDRHVVTAMRKSGAILGGEQSGHLIFMEHGTTGDGLLAGLQLLRIMKEQNKPISQLADILHMYPQKLISFSVGSKPSFDSIPELTEALKQADSKLAGKGRVLLRYSGTEAKCRVMVEGEDEHNVEKIATTIASIIKQKLQ